MSEQPTISAAASNSHSTALLQLNESQRNLLKNAIAAQGEPGNQNYWKWVEASAVRALLEAPLEARRAIAICLAYIGADETRGSRYGLLRELLDKEDALDGTSANEILKALVEPNYTDVAPVFVKHLIKLHKRGELTNHEDLKIYLERNAIFWRERRELRTLEAKVKQLLGSSQELRLPLTANQSWAEQLHVDFKALPEPQQAVWMTLINHGISASGSGPSNAWLKTAKKLASSLPAEALSSTLARWLNAVDGHKNFPGEENEPLLKALIWTAGIGDPHQLAALLGDLAVNFYTKVYMRGPRSRILGNACIQILCLLDKPGVVQLSRLRSKIRYSQGKALIEKSVIKAAQRAGMDPDDMEEVAVPEMGFDSEGIARFDFGEARAQLRLVGETGLVTEWYGADDKAIKSVPAAVKRDHGDELKEWQTSVKEFSAAISGQRTRFEQAYLRQRRWNYAEWRERFIDSTELLGWMGRRLVWNIETGGQSVAVMGLDGQLKSLAGELVDSIPGQAQVTLWHPIQAPVAEVLAWREKLLQNATLQPMRQVFREVYVLTDAERESGSVSQRFAGHLLKQFQLKALLQERAWSYTLQGTWDSHNTPCKPLPNLGLHVLFDFQVPNAFSNLTGDTGVYAYVESGGFSFVDKDNRAVKLADVPPLAFSEVLRDMDLFVSVCSAANDPEQGFVDDPAFHSYITFADAPSSGDLQGGIRVRHDLLDNILSRLPIAKRCRLDGRYLVVKGDLRTYRIHLGSSNILIQPDNRYLCIVKDSKKTPAASGVYLPFEGDALLSLILSKALLLANDKKIKDPDILNQINGG